MDLMTAQQVADELLVDKRTVYRWIKEGKLPVIRLSKKILRVKREKLDQFIALLEDAGRGA